MDGYEATAVAQFTPIRFDMGYLPAQRSATRRGRPVRLGRHFSEGRRRRVDSGCMTERGERMMGRRRKLKLDATLFRIYGCARQAQ